MADLVQQWHPLRPRISLPYMLSPDWDIHALEGCALMIIYTSNNLASTFLEHEKFIYFPPLEVWFKSNRLL
jgi:hypothetical protein